MRSLFFWHVMQRRLVVTLPTFPNNRSVSSLSMKQSKETVTKLNALHCVISQKNEDLLYIMAVTLCLINLSIIWLIMCLLNGMKRDLQQFSSTECVDIMSQCVCFETLLVALISFQATWLLASSQILWNVTCEIFCILLFCHEKRNVISWRHKMSVSGLRCFT